MSIFEVDILACVETWLEMSYRVLWFLRAVRVLAFPFCLLCDGSGHQFLLDFLIPML
jgi:hypothetical protein